MMPGFYRKQIMVVQGSLTSKKYFHTIKAVVDTQGAFG